MLHRLSLDGHSPFSCLISFRLHSSETPFSPTLQQVSSERIEMRLVCLQITRMTTTTITPYTAVTTTITISTLLGGGQRQLCTKDVVYPWKHRSHRVLFYSHSPVRLQHIKTLIYSVVYSIPVAMVSSIVCLLQNICQNVHNDRSPNRKLSDLRQKLK